MITTIYIYIYIQKINCVRRENKIKLFVQLNNNLKYLFSIILFQRICSTWIFVLNSLYFLYIIIHSHPFLQFWLLIVNKELIFQIHFIRFARISYFCIFFFFKFVHIIFCNYGFFFKVLVTSVLKTSVLVFIFCFILIIRKFLKARIPNWCVLSFRFT